MHKVKTVLQFMTSCFARGVED